MAEDTPSLLEAASLGDDAALGELMARHVSGLHAFVRLRAGRLLQARESVSDLVQSACREVLEDLRGRSFQGEDAFRRWLYLAATRKVIDRARYQRAGRRDVARDAGGTSTELAAFCASVATPSRAMASREEVERIVAAFDALSDEHREIILLVRFLGLSHAEASRQTGRTEQATRSLLSRALARLAALLDRSGDP